MTRCLIFATAILLGSNSALADDPCDLRYRVAPRYESTPRRLDVELSFPAEGRHESWLRLQAGWAGIKDFGAALTPAPEQSASVKLLPSPDANRWKVEHSPDGLVKVSYQIRAALEDPDNGKAQPSEQLFRAQLGATWFQFFGYAVLPSVEAWDDTRSGRMCLSVIQPEGHVGPVLGSYFDGQVRPRADAEFQGTHAQLHHAFYAGGSGWRVIERILGTGPVVVASRGDQALEDKRFAEQVTSLLEAHRRFWDDDSSPRQTVVRTPNNSQKNYTGTLVRQAAVLHVSQDIVANNDSFEFLIGHENLHLWLPNRLGGHGSGNDEQAARSYWLSEGFTDYYTHRLLLAGDLWTLDHYATELTRVLRTYWRSPARNATAESIAPRFFSDRDAGRQMYARGELLAMRWDRQLRTKSPSGLDGLVRGLLLTPEQAAKAEPAQERVLQALTSELGPNPREQVQAYIAAGRSFDLDEGLAGPCFELGWVDIPRWVLGFDPASFAKHAAVGVVDGGPAQRAGLRNGMTLMGWSVYGGDISREVVLKVKSEDGDKELRYLPIDGATDRSPMLSVRPGAAVDSACQAWIRR